MIKVSPVAGASRTNSLGGLAMNFASTLQLIMLKLSGSINRAPVTSLAAG